MSRQNRRERFWITAKALARRAEGRMPESTAGMRESGVRIVREKAMDGFFNNLLDLKHRRVCDSGGDRQ